MDDNLTKPNVMVLDKFHLHLKRRKPLNFMANSNHYRPLVDQTLPRFKVRNSFLQKNEPLTTTPKLRKLELWNLFPPSLSIYPTRKGSSIENRTFL